VRGDSRQDLYAKFLALAGLGLMAGVGALVDYWPTDVRVPRAANAIARVPAVARALPVPPAPVALVALAGTPARLVRPGAATTQVSDTGLPVADLLSTPDVTTPAFVTPPAPAAFDVASSVASAVPAQPVALSEPPSLAASDPVFAEPLRQFSTDQQSSDGFFLSDAFKAAGGSLVSAGGSIATVGTKAGESMAGAFRAAAGAVKKLKFF
jgi:hypothetical protein